MAGSAVLLKFVLINFKFEMAIPPFSNKATCALLLNFYKPKFQVHHFPKFNATGRSLLIKFNSPFEEQNPGTYLKECITKLTNYLFNDVPERNLVGLRIRNTENVENKVLGISLRRRDKLKPDVVGPYSGR